jgi:HSP20 family protein
MKGGLKMALIRWSPTRGMVGIQDEMNRLFNDFLSSAPGENAESGLSYWGPSVDISENDDEILLEAEVPGMNRDDIKITIQDNVLTLKGEKKQQAEKKGTNYHRIERSYGSFERSFSLPTSVQADQVKANYQNGILHVKLPKSEEAKPKEISVSVN